MYSLKTIIKKLSSWISSKLNFEQFNHFTCDTGHNVGTNKSLSNIERLRELDILLRLMKREIPDY